MKDLTINKYKDKDTKETINFIKSFFEEKGFSFKIKHTKSFENLYSCELELIYNNEVIHKSNGKGTTKEFSEASGYAEMMERIISKNINGANYVIQQNIERKKPFYITKDEKIFTYDEIKDINYKMLAKYKKETTEQKYKEILFECYDFIEDNQRKYICVPFKNMFTEEVEYVPYQIYTTLTGSTGLAFGNTFEEASVQAISEIIEREVIIKVGTKQTNTPIIPNEHIRFLNIDLYNTIKEIEKDGRYKIIIKETSLGKNYPAISVVLYDKNNFSYLVKTGVFPIFDIALERCLTEMYQNYTDKTIRNLTKEQNLSRKKEEDFEPKDIFNIIDSCNYYHDSFFLTNNSEYSISHFSKETSNKEFLKYYKNLLKNNGYEIFYRETKVKDSSVVNICIPFMSETIGNKITDLLNGDKFFIKNNISTEEIKELYLSSRQHIYLFSKKEMNDLYFKENMLEIVKILIEQGFLPHIENYFWQIKQRIANIYYSKIYEKYSNSYKEMFLNLFNIVSIIELYISFHKHKEENLLFIENPFIDNKSKKLIKALKENDKEYFKQIFIYENLFINKNLEKEIVEAYDSLFY